MEEVCLMKGDEGKIKGDLLGPVSYRKAKMMAPWAAIIVNTQDGYVAFWTIEDYLKWKRECEGPPPGLLRGGRRTEA